MAPPRRRASGIQNQLSFCRVRNMYLLAGLANNCCETASCKLGCPCLDIHSLATNHWIHELMGLLERSFLPRFKWFWSSDSTAWFKRFTLLRTWYPKRCYIIKALIFEPSVRTDDNFCAENRSGLVTTRIQSTQK